MSIDDKNQEQSSYQYKYSCTLVVPGLLELAPIDHELYRDEKSQYKELELFLAKAKQKSHSRSGFERVLFELFGMTDSPDQVLPVAPISYLADTDNRVTGWCLRADPVHLTPDRDELMLSGPETLSLAMSEAEHLATELNVLFKEDGWRIEAITPTRWYLHLPDDPKIKTTDLSHVRDRSISHFLPGGPKGKQWHRIMNEVQMVLHASEVNSERLGHGQHPVSSLWFWGGGELPEFSHSLWSQVWSDEALSLGLAQVTRTPRFSVPKNGKDWLAEVNSPGEHLIVCNDIQLKRQESGPDAWHEELREFGTKWLDPLLKALRTGDIDQLSLSLCDGRTYSLTNSRLKHWWRRRKPLEMYYR